jgi:toxin-antitoxin system PIN domain toxin
MRSLLDINVLIALFDQDHVDHDRARTWLRDHISSGWASCAITQNGFVRIVTQPGYPNPISLRDAVRRLARAVDTEHHEFWPCTVSILDPDLVNHGRLLGHRQITDVYLLAPAVANGGRFVTFDRTVNFEAVPAAVPASLSFI